MTRAERLAEQVRKATEKLAAQRQTVAQRKAVQKAALRQDVNRRRYRVGALADEAGLFVLDDATLAGLFALLGPLTQVPNPVAVLESLLGDPEGPALGAVHGMAEAGPRVSPAC